MRKVVEIIDQENGHKAENINFIVDIGHGRVEELISYNKLLELLETAQDNDMGMDQELLKFKTTIGHFDCIRSRFEGQQIQCSSGMGDGGDYF